MSVLFKDKITGIWKRAAANLIYASFPVGSIVAYGGSSDADAPAGCMYCHGQVLNESEYPDLYAVIGTKFGTGDGSAGSFNLPDLQGQFLRGAGTNSDSTQGGGGTVGTRQRATAIPEIWCDVGPNPVLIGCAPTVSYDGMYYPSVNPSHLDNYVNTATSTPSQTYPGYGKVQNVRPTNTSVEYIIKVVK